MGMGKSEKGTVKETQQEKDAADRFMQRYVRYKEKELPVQQQAIRTINRLKEPDSFEEGRAVSRAVGATAGQYDTLGTNVARQMRSGGVDAGSGAFKMGQAAIGDERAKATGIAQQAGKDAIKDAYFQGLSNMIAIGKNQADQATKGSAAAGGIAAGNAASGALIGAQRRAGNMELAGTAVGLGIGAYNSRPTSKPNFNTGITGTAQPFDPSTAGTGWGLGEGGGAGGF